MSERVLNFGDGTVTVRGPNGYEDTYVVRDVVITLTDQPAHSLEARRGIAERVYGLAGPLIAPTIEGASPRLRGGWYAKQIQQEMQDTLNWVALHQDPKKLHKFRACGIVWDYHDIDRFLAKCTWHFGPNGWCLMFNGARSRGQGNQAWYGSFWCKGKTVRAHKFFAVAILGLRPRPNRVDELDHHCFNTRCVSCVQVLPYAENQKRIRRRKDYDAATQG